MEEEIRKDEKYVKNLLAGLFEESSLFSQFEFTPVGGKERADYAVLSDDRFTYFEIKTEFDDFSRVIRQVEAMRPMFTHIYVVIPEKAVNEYLSLDFGEHGALRNRAIAGVYTIEQLENGEKKPLFEDEYGNKFGQISINAIADLLWVDELRKYVSLKLPDAFIVESHYEYKSKKNRQKRKNLNNMTSADLIAYFKLVYCSLDSFDILKDVLRERNYEYRDKRQLV